MGKQGRADPTQTEEVATVTAARVIELKQTFEALDYDQSKAAYNHERGEPHFDEQTMQHQGVIFVNTDPYSLRGSLKATGYTKLITTMDSHDRPDKAILINLWDAGPDGKPTQEIGSFFSVVSEQESGRGWHYSDAQRLEEWLTDHQR